MTRDDQNPYASPVEGSDDSALLFFVMLLAWTLNLSGFVVSALLMVICVDKESWVAMVGLAGCVVEGWVLSKIARE